MKTASLLAGILLFVGGISKISDVTPYWKDHYAIANPSTPHLDLAFYYCGTVDGDNTKLIVCFFSRPSMIPAMGCCNYPIPMLIIGDDK